MGLIDLSGTYCASAKNSDNSRLNILSAILSFSTALTAEKTAATAWASLRLTQRKPA